MVREPDEWSRATAYRRIQMQTLFPENLSTKSILCVYEWETFLDLKLTYTSKIDV